MRLYFSLLFIATCFLNQASYSQHLLSQLREISKHNPPLKSDCMMDRLRDYYKLEDEELVFHSEKAILELPIQTQVRMSAEEKALLLSLSRFTHLLELGYLKKLISQSIQQTLKTHKINLAKLYENETLMISLIEEIYEKIPILPERSLRNEALVDNIRKELQLTHDQYDRFAYLSNHRSPETRQDWHNVISYLVFDFKENERSLFEKVSDFVKQILKLEKNQRNNLDALLKSANELKFSPLLIDISGKVSKKNFAFMHNMKIVSELKVAGKRLHIIESRDPSIDPRKFITSEHKIYYLYDSKELTFREIALPKKMNRGSFLSDSHNIIDILQREESPLLITQSWDADGNIQISKFILEENGEVIPLQTTKLEIDLRKFGSKRSFVLQATYHPILSNERSNYFVLKPTSETWPEVVFELDHDYNLVPQKNSMYLVHNNYEDSQSFKKQIPTVPLNLVRYQEEYILKNPNDLKFSRWLFGIQDLGRQKGSNLQYFISGYKRYDETLFSALRVDPKKLPHLYEHLQYQSTPNNPSNSIYRRIHSKDFFNYQGKDYVLFHTKKYLTPKETRTKDVYQVSAEIRTYMLELESGEVTEMPLPKEISNPSVTVYRPKKYFKDGYIQNFIDSTSQSYEDNHDRFYLNVTPLFLHPDEAPQWVYEINRSKFHDVKSEKNPHDREYTHTKVLQFTIPK